MLKGSPTTSVPVLLLLLLLLLSSTTVSPQCHTATEEECEEHKDFVPGYHLAGEGIDITTLERKGVKILEMNQWEKPDGTCTLCRNPLLEGKPLQKLPLAVADWEAKISCQRKMHSTLQESGMSVVQAEGSDVKNDWKVGLDVDVHPKAQVHVALEGSHSKVADFSIDKTSKDQYSFVKHEVSCLHYSFHISHHKPLTQHFKHAVKSLPKTYKRATLLEYHQLIGTYGTHFIKQLHLGGHVRDVTALRVCETVLDKVSADEIKDCLSIEASTSIGNGKVKMDASYKTCEELKNKKDFKGSFHQKYNERHTDIVGGNNHMDLLFADDQNAEAFKEWVESLKSMPGVVSYSLEPIHTLLPKEDPKRESVRQAVSEYIKSRALWRNCTQPCPPGTQRSVRDPCSCVCPRDGITNTMCCSPERGLGKLTVTIQRAQGLWGDYFTKTDAFVKVFFQKKEMRTSTVWNNDNPVWQVHFDLGSIQLLEGANNLRVQVWDEDNKYDDDLLGSCERTVKAGKSQPEVCYFSHGHLEFQYHFVCGRHLGGPSCWEYVAEPPKHSGALLQYKTDSALVKQKAP